MMPVSVHGTRFSAIGATALAVLLMTSTTMQGCASASKSAYRDVDVAAGSLDQAIKAASAALDRDYDGVVYDARSGIVTAEPLYIDFGETELDAVAQVIERPEDVTQAFGRIRRIPSIKLDQRRSGEVTFQVKVERQVEELDAGYVPYEQPYDLHQASAMPVNPSDYGAGSAPPKEEWVPQGNDFLYEDRIRRALAEELGR